MTMPTQAEWIPTDEEWDTMAQISESQVGFALQMSYLYLIVAV